MKPLNIKLIVFYFCVHLCMKQWNSFIFCQKHQFSFLQKKCPIFLEQRHLRGIKAAWGRVGQSVLDCIARSGCCLSWLKVLSRPSPSRHISLTLTQIWQFCFLPTALLGYRRAVSTAHLRSLVLSLLLAWQCQGLKVQRAPWTRLDLAATAGHVVSAILT